MPHAALQSMQSSSTGQMRVRAAEGGRGVQVCAVLGVGLQEHATQWEAGRRGVTVPCSRSEVLSSHGHPGGASPCHRHPSLHVPMKTSVRPQPKALEEEGALAGSPR